MSFGRRVIALGVLEMVTQREHREHRLVLVRILGQLDRPLQVLARLGRVADAAEHATEDAVRAARGPHLPEALGEPQGLLGGVDGEHVSPTCMYSQAASSYSRTSASDGGRP